MLPESENTIRQPLWQQAGLLAVAALLLYFPVMTKLVHDWWGDPNFSHGFLIPPLAGYLIWQRKEKLVATPARPSNWGLLIAVAAAALLFLGSLGAELFLTRVSLVLMLAALLVFFAGWKGLSLLAVPLAVLLLMIPVPQVVFNQVAFPLQLTASRFASGCLSSLGVPVLREGNLILLPNNVTLEVVEACSGIRSLMSLLSLGVAYSYFFESSLAVRWILIGATIPIAVMANGLRITGTGVLTYLVGGQAAEGFFHVFSGWMVFVCAFLILVVVHRIISLCRGGFHRGAVI